MRVLAATTILCVALVSAWARPALAAPPDSVVHGLGGSGGGLDEPGGAVHQTNLGESTAGAEMTSADGQVRMVGGFVSALLTTPTPEPSAGLQWLGGLAGTLGLARLRRRRVQARSHFSLSPHRPAPNRSNGD